MAKGLSFERFPVLIVEDDPSLQRVMAIVLEDAGYAIVTASDGLEALHILERVRPGIVLLDMRMPIMGGLEFVNCLRQRSSTNIPIVLVTAEPAALKKRWDRIDVDGFLGKPFDIDELTQVVARYYKGTNG